MSELQKILIVGNMGYVGPAVTRHLRRTFPASWIAGYDAGFFAHCLTNVDTLPETHLNQQYFGDVRDLDASKLHDIDTVINLAAVSNDPMGKSFEEATYAINHKAAVALANKAKTAGVRNYVFASSCSAYGSAAGGPRKEQDSLDPLTAYAKSKVATEQGVAELSSDDFVVTCLRFPTACGMSSRLRLDLVLNDFVASALLTGKVEILSDGTPWRPLIDTQDMALAIEWAAVRESTNGGPFLAINAGHEKSNYQIKELAELVAQELPGTSVSLNPDNVADKRSYQVNFDLYNQLAPNHLPRISIEQSIRELATGIRNLHFEDDNFRDSPYVRLRILSDLRSTSMIDAQLRWSGGGS